MQKIQVPTDVLAMVVDDIETFARIFHFVVPASVSQLKALLAGLDVDQWRDVRDPNDTTQVY